MAAPHPVVGLCPDQWLHDGAAVTAISQIRDCDAAAFRL